MRNYNNKQAPTTGKTSLEDRIPAAGAEGVRE